MIISTEINSIAKHVGEEKAVEMVLAGEIPDGKTQLAILKTKAYIEKEGKTL